MLEVNKLIEETNNAIKWLKDYVEKTGAKGVVVGNSGGKDSATVIAMATKALGKDHVVTVSMPCNSVQSDFEDAKLVADTFEVPFLKVDLSETYADMEDTINTSLCDLKTELNKEAKINIKPRLRMATLYGIAQSLKYLVIGTGNLCESLVGYTTKWGDNACDFNPIANFTVPEVLAIGKYLGVPDKIINKSPNDGLGGKTDEEKMGVSYIQIEEYIETGRTRPDAMLKIEKLNQISKHKRNPIPVYDFPRKKYLT